MTGGNYITWFKEDGSKERSLLYKLENMNILKLTNELDDEQSDKFNFYIYKWILTPKGQSLIDDNKLLHDIWGEGKMADVIKFYDEILNIFRQRCKEVKK